ncbi:hypothetical protein [uncultured Leptotrichia sp.]|uniref:hypothetical protein n=1 Tax=uncultured Leptotrichia sp. TaxID=159271 RepID=UPI0025D58445|nr:hypothetical protein [uncultured Leptotrichia sp.]
MNIRNLIKKMILIFGVIGISLTAFAAPRRNNKVVYVKKEPTRKIVRRRYIFVKVPKKQNSKVVYVKKEPTRRQRAAARAKAARRR